MTAAEDLRALSAAATEGPWETVMVSAGRIVDAPEAGVAVAGCSVVLWRENAELVVWCRNHADALADLIDAARLFVDPATPHEATCYSREAAMRAPRECPCDCGLDDLRDALAALEADQ